MKAFKREERYMVVKLSKLADDQGKKMSRSEEIYRIAHFGKALVESVVIESDWPEYATVWKMVEDRVMGNPTPDHTNCHANGRKQAEQIDALQSELTKARDMVRWFYTHANVHQVGTVMMDAAREFIARQSAPAAKGGA